MFLALLLFAEEQPQGSPLGILVPLLPILILFYFFMLRPMRRQEAERQALVSNLNKNDKVITSAGIYGTVVSVSDKEDEVVVKVDDGSRVRMTKGSIHRNITAEEAAKAAKDQKDKK